MSSLAPFTIIWTLINIGLLALGVYIAILLIKALKIYINKNK